MIKLLIATTNPGKFEEARLALDDSDVEILSLKDFPGIKQVPETGETFEENAVSKAKGYFEKTGVPTIADDGGLIVDELGGLPGVNSHRWLGYDANEEELARAVIKKLKDVPREKRTAKLGRFIIFWDGKHLLKSSGWIEGYVAEKIMGEVKPGFPYRAIFTVNQFNKPFGELTPAEEAELNNSRIKNFLALKPKIFSALGRPASGWE